MANRIKGITVEIGGDTTKLTKAINDTNASIRDTQSELKKVERLLKLDPTNVELLAQKQKLLAEAVEETTQKEKTLAEAVEQANEQLKSGKIDEKQYNALKTELEGARREADAARTAYAEFNPELERTSQIAGKAATELNKVGEATRGLSTAAGAVAGALVASAVSAANYADELSTLSKQSGFATETLQRWEYAAELVDVSVEDIIGAARKLKKNMASDSADVAAAWQKLGISVTDAAGQYRDAESVFNDVLLGLSLIPNETERDILAMELFGKSADDLAGIIDDGGAALRAYGDEAESLGLILDNEALQGANDFSDGLEKLKIQAQKAFVSAGSELAEKLLPQLDKLAEKLSDLFTWLANLDGEKVLKTLKLAAIVAAISPIATALGETIQGIKTLIDLTPKIGAAFKKISPQVLIISAAIGALAVGLYEIIKNWKNMDGIEKVASVLGALMIAAAGAAVAVGALQSALTQGIAAAAIVAGIAMIVGAVTSAERRAKSLGGSASDNELKSLADVQNDISSGINMATPSYSAYDDGRSTRTTTITRGTTQTTNATAYKAAAPSETNVNISFEGDLSGLARVLQPAIRVETARQGLSAAR